MSRTIYKGFLLACALLLTTCGSDNSGTDTLVVSDVDQGEWATVLIAWRANAEHDLAGYRLYQSNVSRRYTQSKRILEVPAGVETCTIGPLPPGTYFWVLTAFNASLYESDYSNEVTVVIE